MDGFPVKSIAFLIYFDLYNIPLFSSKCKTSNLRCGLRKLSGADGSAASPEKPASTRESTRRMCPSYGERQSEIRAYLAAPRKRGQPKVLRILKRSVNQQPCPWWPDDAAGSDSGFGGFGSSISGFGGHGCIYTGGSHESGTDFVKIFPLNPATPKYLRTLLEPLPFLKLIPSGGITLKSLPEIFSNGAAAPAAHDDGGLFGHGCPPAGCSSRAAPRLSVRLRNRQRVF